MRGVAFEAGEGDGDLVVAGDVGAGVRGPTWMVEPGGSVGLLAEQDFDAAGGFGGSGRTGRRVLRMAAESGEGGGEEEGGEGF